jgi:sugar/nucleoside kinase (ribokinase family)
MENTILCFGRPIIDIYVEVGKTCFESISREQESIGNSEMIERLRADSSILRVSAGGVESNVAINSAVLGTRSILFGFVGKNDLLSQMLEWYSRILSHKMTLALHEFDGDSATIIDVRTTGNNAMRIKLVRYGNSDLLRWNSKLEKCLTECTVFFSSLYVPSSPLTEGVWIESLKAAKNIGKTVAVNLGGIGLIPLSSRVELISLINENAHIISMNKIECDCCSESFGGGGIREIFNRPYIVAVTLGEKGAVFYCDDGRLVIKNPDVGLIPQVFDVGCGDAFFSGFIHSLCSGEGVEKSGRLGVWIATKKLRYQTSHINVGENFPLEGGVVNAFR